ncbi:AraC family transcriptional regulator [Bacillus sp. AFS031507]|uniref:helix-turn-helix domain-containing protein n=1 Tax=Bacillus sp. AFS031507 TaxID=2033496 RepID=UPI000BFDB80F|nr:AraC family transcriptional regulator [Bacillus sp. AFS031507]PGY11914.1 AraC family transcriptional regulator [Bacillus sp. AFS031507]
MVVQSSKVSEGILNQYAMWTFGEEISFKVHYWGVNPGHFNNPVHRHSFFEVCYVLSGDGLYKDLDEQYTLKKGTVFLSRPNIQHQILSETGLFLVFVAFEILHEKSKDDAIRMFNLLAKTNKICISAADDSPTALIWRALVDCSSNGGANDLNFITSMAHTLILSFSTMFSETNQRSSSQEKMFSNSSPTHLYQAKLFIRDNLSEPLKLEDVANYLHISSRHLSRLFSNELSESFSNYIRKERVREAARLLEMTSIPIKEIADVTGFGSVHYFTRVFTTMMNVSPAKYRNDYVKKKI